MTTIARAILHQPTEGYKLTLKMLWKCFVIVLKDVHPERTRLIETWRAELRRPQLGRAY